MTHWVGAKSRKRTPFAADSVHQELNRIHGSGGEVSLNIACCIAIPARGCRAVSFFPRLQNRLIVHNSEENQDHYANAAFLLGAYLARPHARRRGGALRARRADPVEGPPRRDGPRSSVLFGRDSTHRPVLFGRDSNRRHVLFGRAAHSTPHGASRLSERRPSLVRLSGAVSRHTLLQCASLCGWWQLSAEIPSPTVCQ
jgi:hypothetical protein